MNTRFLLPSLLAILLPLPIAAQEPEIATTLTFTEGPTVDTDGSVYFTEIITQRIIKLGPDGRQTTWRENSKALR